MRLVVPFVSLRQETYRATRNWPNVTYRYVGDSETAYSELVCELWAQGQEFCLVEHDIVVAKGMLDRLAKCDQPMCAHPYEWTTNLGPALGCNRFSAQLLADFPDAASEAAAINGGHGPGSWRTFDYWLTRTILEEKYGQVAHLHLPPVLHLNEAKRLLPIYRDRPLSVHLRHVGYELSADGHSATWVGRMRRAVQPSPDA